MELIIIRGCQNDGKTTTATMLHNDIVGRSDAKVKLLRTNGNYLSVNGWMVDFQSVIDLGKKRIVIISEGDDDDRLAELMDELADDYRPDVMVVSARARNREGSSYRMLTERYADLLRPENEFWTEYADDPALAADVKGKVVGKIVDRIAEL